MAAIHYCKRCGGVFQAGRPWALFCSDSCARSHKRKDAYVSKFGSGIHCKICGTWFCPMQKYGGNVQHCSDTCSRVSARNSRSQFWRRHGKPRALIYRERSRQRIGPTGNLVRLRKRYPDLPKQCEACGEHRVLDVAHKPGHERNGAWRSKANCTPDKIWILCPTCHALLDRMHYDPSELGLTL